MLLEESFRRQAMRNFLCDVPHVSPAKLDCNIISVFSIRCHTRTCMYKLTYLPTSLIRPRSLHIDRAVEQKCE
jgi:hypothetical protein